MHKVDGNAGTAEAPGSSDAVNVIFKIGTVESVQGQVVVDNLGGGG